MDNGRRRGTIGTVKNERYPALNHPLGVRMLLADIHALNSRQYNGDYAATDILTDLGVAIAKAGLTEKQRQAIALVYGQDLTQQQAAETVGVRRETVNRLLTVAETKIARVYEYWARHGEGYSITEGDTQDGDT